MPQWLTFLAALVVPTIAIISFWMRFSDRITKAEERSKAAEAIAKEAKADAHAAIEKNAVLAASFALYREQVAREYIHREVMREVEDRLTQAIDRLGERLDRFTEAAISKN